ncbi:M28 family peptidase [Seonamhaeicola algicola]|uniref:M28 family peptidase n=1 Tax=Seonamhaeicola algicola TaxID=1719036 RepID=A0A5C7AX10_9FLAO|nr:M28 family peptidase [Seonamhaeicola algicola]TXE13218.1 M28 family peptidase [Seonamhaeicola algicola]
MFKIKLLLVFFVLFKTAFGYSQNEKNICFSHENLLRHIKTLSSDAFEGRRTGTQGANKAKKYIINQYHTLQVKPFKQGYQQTFLFNKGKKQYKGVNVIGYIKGTCVPNKYIVISAHYDHEGIKNGKIYNGADDNASGLSALFSFAEYFKTHPPKHSVILAAFDAEELGLKGSSYFVNNLNVPYHKILLNINMDMISRSNTNTLHVAGSNIYKQFIQAVCCVAHENFTLKSGHDGFDENDSWVYASDHANFHKKDIPFLYFGVDDHDDYHEPTDDFENIHPTFYIEAVKTIISVFNKIDKS